MKCLQYLAVFLPALAAALPQPGSVGSATAPATTARPCRPRPTDGTSGYDDYYDENGYYDALREGVATTMTITVEPETKTIGPYTFDSTIPVSTMTFHGYTDTVTILPWCN